ncbi:hypothetical protein ERJ75_000186700 [Trypanosoma vivax]|nr:hypothetical protein ERJ75_000186700 [Trypanosoma vivax]
MSENMLNEGRISRLLCLIAQPHNGLSKRAKSVEASSTRIMKPKAVASPEWGPQRNLRAFYLALVRGTICYGNTSWRLEASLPHRERTERVAGYLAHTVAGGREAVRKEGAARETQLRPISNAASRAGFGILPSPESAGPDAWEHGGQHLFT